MVVALIIACEVAFWVLLAAGLCLRYVARRPRAGALVLLGEPLLEVVLLVATAVDLRSGAAPDGKHGIAALYIGFTVAYGHSTVRWIDGLVRHRFAGGPPPVKPPRYGMARARHEGGLWLRTVLAAAVACGLLQLAIRYVGDAGDTSSLRLWQLVALRAAGIHGVIALTYLIWPKRRPPAVGGGVDGRVDGGDGGVPGAAGGAGRAGRGATGGAAWVSARRPVPTARRRSTGWPSGRG